MLGEAPSTAMLTDLVTKANAGSTVQELADSLATNAAFTSSFPVWQTATEFTTKVVNNMFAGGTVSQADKDAAIDYIAGAITAGTFTKTSAVVALTSYMASAAGVANASYGSVSQAYQNKVAVAEYYTINKGLGDSSAAERKAAIAGVTSEAASVTSEKASADTASVAADVIPGKALSLTSALDSLVGTAGDDSINAAISANGASPGSTIAPGDVINGGAGIDTLSIAVAGALATNTPYTLAAVQTNNVEKIFVSNFDTVTGGTPEEDNVIDGALMTGLTTVGLSASSANGDTQFSNLKNIVDIEMMNGAADLTVGYTAAAVTGTQTQNIAVSNLSAGTLTVNGTENLVLTTGLVKSTLAGLASDKMKSLTISGATDLTVTAALNFANDATGVAGAIDGTVDASAFTGKLKITSAADEVSITGGTANDTINMVSTLNGFDKIDGGDGVDTLTMTGVGFASTTFAQVSNVESIVTNPSAAAVAFDASRLPAGTTSLTVDLNDAAQGTGAKLASTVTKADGMLINIAKTTLDQADVNDSDGTTLTITNTTDSAADTVNIQLSNIGQSLIGTTEGGIDEVDVSTMETINITANTNALGTASLNEIEALTATVATTITVDGTGAFETVMTGAKVTTFDASALAGKLTLTAGSEKATYSMGGKSSSIVFGGNLNASDTVIGGAGTADVITATVGGLSATTGALNLSAVEAAALTTSAANTINLAGVTGLGSLTVTDNKQTITNLDLATTTITLGLVGDESATGSEIDVTAADATGTDDTLNVNVNAENGAPSSIIDASGIENLAVKVGTSTTATANTTTLDLTTFEGTSVSLSSGSLGGAAFTTTPGAIVLGTLHKNATSLTSTNKQAVTASFANATDAVTFSGVGTGIQNVTGGLRGDTFTIGTTAAITHAISGGAGTDTTNLTVFTNFVNPSTIDTENINITVPASVDVVVGTDFGNGVDNVTLIGGNSLSTFDAGTIDAAIKTVSGADFLGNVLADFAADNFDSTVSVTGGPLKTDAVTAVLTTNGTYVPVTSGVEKLNLDTNGDVTASLASATGVTSVEVDLSTASKTAKVSGLSATQTVVLTGSANANNVLEAIPVDATDADNVVNFKLKDDATITANTKLKTTDVETVNLTTSTVESIDLSLLTMTSALKALTLNVITDPTTLGTVTLSATSAQTTTINASLASGVTQTARSATTAVDYTGSAGADRFIMATVGDKIAGGGGAADTLDVNYGSVLGGISVDLSSAGEQILAMDGGAISGSITGFESVDLAGYSGGGAAVTAIKTGSTITGTASTDRITGGAGNDTVRIVQTANLDTDVVVGGGGSDTLLVIDGVASSTLNQNIIDLTTPGNGLLNNIGAFANYSGIENVDVSAEAGDGFTITGSASNNSIKGGAGKDNITMGAGGTNSVDAGDGADVIVFASGTDTLVVSAVGDVEAANKAVTNVAGTANAVDATDTIALGAALGAGITVVETLTTFTTLTDKIDLSAFALTGAATPTSDGGGGNALNIADGKYAIIRGGVVAGTGVFTVNASGVDSLVIWDGDTTGSVSVVGVVIDAGVAVAGDLILA
jgi:hypothetical protein